MPQNESLPLEEFSKRGPDSIPTYNNLVIYFRNTALGKIFREQPSFQRFKEEHPDLERKLHEAISAMDVSNALKMSEDLRPFDKDIYDFYLTMRSYGTPDENLIGRA